MLGEVGLFSAERRRSAGAEAMSRVVVAELSVRRVRQLQFDNPEFAYRLLRLITRRLVANLERMEQTRLPAPPGSTG